MAELAATCRRCDLVFPAKIGGTGDTLSVFDHMVGPCPFCGSSFGFTVNGTLNLFSDLAEPALPLERKKEMLEALKADIERFVREQVDKQSMSYQPLEHNEPSVWSPRKPTVALPGKLIWLLKIALLIVTDFIEVPKINPGSVVKKIEEFTAEWRNVDSISVRDEALALVRSQLDSETDAEGLQEIISHLLQPPRETVLTSPELEFVEANRLELIHDRIFVGVVVDIDGRFFKHCLFDRCLLRYSADPLPFLVTRCLVLPNSGLRVPDVPPEEFPPEEAVTHVQHLLHQFSHLKRYFR